ncbi:hypothetical protein G195_009928 [Phytophthora kernoviae 00238/432]|uniref:Uncharacterized protein n=2 Tax=Phytophthora kernoviae TaxID=325452 RepID=A0A8T0LM48_9STRA|nr:hypothetical protein G195_009928 [Phytophthora kernoviae 00238/432]KAG2511698.1 hypothetical protein JM16_008158 [Phytophthora kernoviae]
MLSFADAVTPVDGLEKGYRASKCLFISVTDNENVCLDGPEAETAEYRDFVGTSCITLDSIILSIVFLLKKWNALPMWEKIPALSVVVVCFSLGCYVTYMSGENLFSPSYDDTEFPFCAPEFKITILW